MKKEVLIENWRIIAADSPYTAPECLGSRKIVGEVFGHPKKEDGAEVITSRIITIGKFEEGSVIETRNTLYKLGKMSEEYAEWWKGMN